MTKVELLHHEQTGTYWSNDKDWKEKWKSESITYGHIEMNTDNIFELKSSMNNDGYELVKDTEGTPFNSSDKYKIQNT